MNKLFLVSIILLAFLVGSCSSEAGSNADKAVSTEKSTKKEVKWIGFNEGLAKAQKESKPMLIDFYTDWCHWCKVMDEKTFSDSKVAAKLSDKFVTVRIDAEDGNSSVQFKGESLTNIELTRAFQVSGFPSLGFLDAKGEPITVIPGYIPPETFINILDYMDQECYKKQISFEDYLKKKEDCK